MRAQASNQSSGSSILSDNSNRVPPSLDKTSGLILEPFEVDAKTNEIKALPPLIQKLALKGVVFAFDAINTQKKLVN